MAFRPANCPNCGGALQLPDDRETVNCMYCGTPIMVHEVIRVQMKVNTKSLLELARVAAKARNHQEAYNYFTRVLEYEPDNVEAWIGKGIAAGWQTTLGAFRVPEMIVAFEKALELSSETNRQSIRQVASHNINEVCADYYFQAGKHLDQVVTQDGAWEEYLGRCAQALSALEDAHRLSPSSIPIVRNIILISDDNLEGTSYFSQALKREVPMRTDPKYQQVLRGYIEKYSAILKQLDPRAPSLTRRKGGISKRDWVMALSLLVLAIVIPRQCGKSVQSNDVMPPVETSAVSTVTTLAAMAATPTTSTNSTMAQLATPVAATPALSAIRSEAQSTIVASGEKSGLEETLEYKMASINKGYPVSRDDETIARFRHLLDAIDAKTPESRQQVADMLVKAQELLKDKYGKNVNLLELAEGANTAIPDGADVSTAEVLAALIQMIR